jgi:hypothetical protein
LIRDGGSALPKRSVRNSAVGTKSDGSVPRDTDRPLTVPQPAVFVAAEVE